MSFSGTRGRSRDGSNCKLCKEDVFFRAVQNLEQNGLEASQGVALSQDPAPQVLTPKELLLAGFSRAQSTPLGGWQRRLMGEEGQALGTSPGSES